MGQTARIVVPYNVVADEQVVKQFIKSFHT